MNGASSFTIGDGGADVDLLVAPALADNGATVGAVTKSGAGTLELSGVNTYTGPTLIEAGTLRLGGSLSGSASIEVAAGARFATDDAASIALAPGGGLTLSGDLSPGGAGNLGTLTANFSAGGKLTFLAGSSLTLDLRSAPATSDLISFAAPDDWLGGSGLATLTLGGVIDYAANYTVFQNVTTSGFTFAAITGFDTANYRADFRPSGNDYQLSFVAVPEPNSLITLLSGFGLLAGLRRFRSCHRAKSN